MIYQSLMLVKLDMDRKIGMQSIGCLTNELQEGKGLDVALYVWIDAVAQYAVGAPLAGHRGRSGSASDADYLRQ